MSRMGRRGFTLIEVIWVIGVMIAAAVMFMKLTPPKPKEDVKMTALLRDVQQFVYKSRLQAMKVTNNQEVVMKADGRDLTLKQLNGKVLLNPITLQYPGLNRLSLARIDNLKFKGLGNPKTYLYQRKKEIDIDFRKNEDIKFCGLIFNPFVMKLSMASGPADDLYIVVDQFMNVSQIIL